jgi:hypothetical protein
LLNADEPFDKIVLENEGDRYELARKTPFFISGQIRRASVFNVSTTDCVTREDSEEA